VDLRDTEAGELRFGIMRRERNGPNYTRGQSRANLKLHTAKRWAAVRGRENKEREAVSFVKCVFVS